MNMNVPAADLPVGNAVALLYPDFESFLGLVVETSSPQKADIIELAVARFHLFDHLVDVESYYFQSEDLHCHCSDAGPLPRFSDDRQRVADAVADSRVVVVHDVDQARTLQARLPHWRPETVVSVERLARAVCPAEHGYGLDRLIDRFDIDEKYDLHAYGMTESAIYRCVGTVHVFFELLHAAIGKGFTQEQVRLAGTVRICGDPVPHR